MKMSKESFKELSRVMTYELSKISGGFGTLAARDNRVQSVWCLWWRAERQGRLMRRFYGEGLNDNHVNTALFRWFANEEKKENDIQHKITIDGLCQSMLQG